MHDKNLDVKKAINYFNNGGIVVFPTDTAFGIGCRLDNENAVKKLFRIRNRPETQAAPILVSSIEMAQRYLKPLTDEVKNLMKKYWPGALTIVYPCNEYKIPSLVRGGGATLGVRMPNNKTLLSLIAQLNCPILGPSANFHGEKTPYSIGDLDQNLVKKVDFVLEGKAGSEGTISTVIDCSKNPFNIIRQGAVSINICKM